MDVDRGTLARLDRRLLAWLDREERFQMVRVPVSPATWSTWKRYCETVGISMARAIAALVDHELASMLGDSSGGSGSGFEERRQRRMVDREAALTKRADLLAEAEERMHRLSELLRAREREVETHEWRLEVANKLAARPAESRVKVGRNEPCPCGNGLKYKNCHSRLA